MLGRPCFRVPSHDSTHCFYVFSVGNICSSVTLKLAAERVIDANFAGSEAQKPATSKMDSVRW